MPITGPFQKTVTTSVYYRYQKWYRQPAPYATPLPYDLVVRTSAAGSNSIGQSWAGNASDASFNTADSSPLRVQVINLAYQRFKEQVNEQSAFLSVNLAERKQAVDMMAQRAGKVLRFAKAIKSFRLGEACEALGLVIVSRTKTRVVVKRPRYVNNRLWRSAKDREARRNEQRARVRAGNNSDEYNFYGTGSRTRRILRRADNTVELRIKRNAKSFADNFLEFHFGWEPLVKDIWASANIYLEDPFKGLGKKVKASAKASVKSGGFPVYNYTFGTVNSWTESVVLRANTIVTNPNLRQAEQLGLLNPAVLLYELIPFSFVVNWFVNVEQILSVPTDFAGISFQYASTTRLIKLEEQSYYKYGAIMAPHRNRWHLSLQRVNGISKPELAIRPFKWPSVTRGLTAVSLLAQFLRSV